MDTSIKTGQQLYIISHEIYNNIPDRSASLFLPNTNTNNTNKRLLTPKNTGLPKTHTKDSLPGTACNSLHWLPSTHMSASTHAQARTSCWSNE